LADDHAAILNALERILERSCEIVGSVNRGGSLLEAATRLRPDVVVLDLSMPEIDGLEGCRQIKRVMPRTKVVVISAAYDAELSQEALSLGASAFVLKSLMARDLADAIRTALREDT